MIGSIFPVPRIGFELDGEVIDGPIEMLEGETKELCVSLLDLTESEVYIKASIVLTPDSPTGKHTFMHRTAVTTTLILDW